MVCIHFDFSFESLTQLYVGYPLNLRSMLIITGR